MCLAAVDVAGESLRGLVGAENVGEHLGQSAEGERVVTHYFASRRRGYLHWRWAVTVARASRRREVTVDEVVLLPGPDAVLAPPWVPWRERVQATDVGPGLLLPAEDDDFRLVPGYTGADEDDGDDAAAQTRGVVQELGLGRPRVLSPEGRGEAAERWYAGSHGPQAAIAMSAPAYCGSCGFVARVAGGLGSVFGVCANEFSPSDGKVVSYDHGCGAHSEVGQSVGSTPRPTALPDPALDTFSYDDVELF